MCVSKTFIMTKKSVVICNMKVICSEYPMSSKFHLSKWKILFSQFINKYLKIEEVKYLIHYVKFKICLALFYINSLFFSLHFLMLVLGCTLFPLIYKEMDNWDFECYSSLDVPVFPMMKKIKSLSFLD